MTNGVSHIVWGVFAVVAERMVIYPSFADSDAIKRGRNFNFNDYGSFPAQA